MVNLKTNAHAPLHITGPVLARIYLGQITSWNDPAIKALNPGISLPSQKITPVYRSDGSGTSYNFTDYLSSVSPAFKSKVGVSTQPPFPTGVGGKGSSGVAGVVKSTDGAIGYADIAYAVTNHIQVMAVRNAAGKYTTPGIKSISAAAAAFKNVRHEQRDAHREPAEVGADSRTRSDLHLRDRPAEDVERRLRSSSSSSGH